MKPVTKIDEYYDRHLKEEMQKLIKEFKQIFHYSAITIGFIVSYIAIELINNILVIPAIILSFVGSYALLYKKGVYSVKHLKAALVNMTEKNYTQSLIELIKAKKYRPNNVKLHFIIRELTDQMDIREFTEKDKLKEEFEEEKNPDAKKVLSEIIKVNDKIYDLKVEYLLIHDKIKELQEQKSNIAEETKDNIDRLINRYSAVLEMINKKIDFLKKVKQELRQLYKDIKAREKYVTEVEELKDLQETLLTDTIQDTAKASKYQTINQKTQNYIKALDEYLEKIYSATEHSTLNQLIDEFKSQLKL